VNPQSTAGIVDLAPEEGQMLLSFLYEHKMPAFAMRVKVGRAHGGPERRRGHRRLQRPPHPPPRVDQGQPPGLNRAAACADLFANDQPL
jgi:hypothetical protein